MLGPLPVHLINRCLALDLRPGVVIFYADRQEHAFSDPDNRTREAICRPHFVDLVANPTHIGQQIKYVGRSLELVRETDTGTIVLLAIALRPVRGPFYRVLTCFPIDADKLARRIRKNTLMKVE
jgi:hypothetical protein